MRTNDFIVTVTNNIEGCPIERYLDTICTNVVVGTNIFSDFAASLTDFFGGFSGSYKSKLELIYNEATKELKNKAKNLGANAIVGFSIDFDEVSGSGKSMFMVSASGTACVIKYHDKDTKQIEKTGLVSQEFIDFELKRRLIIKSINSGVSIKPSWEEFLYEHPQKDIVENLINRYKKDVYTELTEKTFIERYLTLLPKSDIVDIVYSSYLEHSKEIGTLIRNCNIFSPKHILDITKKDIHLGIALMNTKSDFYKEEDLLLMKEIIKMIDTLPNTGQIQMVKGGLLSKDQEKFICEKGHKNNKDIEFCETCDINIKGLYRKEVTVIEQLREIVSILENNL